MGYQALLFCPDEKLARVVSQVFSELDFTIDPVHEPFAAVKKLMAQRFDAIVVDCENEQNAPLLLKSARNSSFNQNSLAIAVVEGQAGVAKAYRIGANLVLTKPINVEQAKGTLRVARGLLRKNSDAAGASAAVPATGARTPPVSAGSPSQPSTRGAAAMPTSAPQRAAEAPAQAAVPAMTASMSASTSMSTTMTTTTATTASAKVADKPSPSHAPTPPTQFALAAASANVPPAATSAPMKNDAFTAATGSAAAPAPAKEITARPENEKKTLESEPAVPSHNYDLHDTGPAPISGSVSVADAPSFAALDLDKESDSGSRVKKQILIAAAIVLALAAIGYLGYGRPAKSSATSAPQPVSAPQDPGKPAPALAPMSSPAAPATSTPDRASATITVSKPAAATSTSKLSASVDNSPVIRIGGDSESATTKPDKAPVVVKSSPTAARPRTQVEDSAPALPSSDDVASANDSKLNSLMSSTSSSVSKPTLATVKVSQGVSQGLLIKRVQPEYPPAAIARHAQGAVQIEATVNKEGSVTNLKVLSGDPLLARAALEAVRQWRFKPYYLDGDPVEIQTQITVNFKAAK